MFSLSLSLSLSEDVMLLHFYRPNQVSLSLSHSFCLFILFFRTHLNISQFSIASLSLSLGVCLQARVVSYAF